MCEEQPFTSTAQAAKNMNHILLPSRICPCFSLCTRSPPQDPAQRLSAKDSTAKKCKMRELASAPSKRTWILLGLAETRWKGDALLQQDSLFSLVVVVAWEVRSVVPLLLTWKRSFRYSLHNYIIIKTQPRAIRFWKRFFQQFPWNAS